MVVVVTRPASSGKRLFERVVEHGFPALWWPVFDIGPAPDPERARAMLARLADYDLAIFVSAHAVHGALSLMDRRARWPAGTIIGAVGSATRDAIEAELQPDADVSIVAQDDEQAAGSEGFWRAWQAGGRHARRLLLVRAEAGRDWLGERLAEKGAAVDTVATYSRRPHRPSADELQQLRQWIVVDEQSVTIFASTEAVAALDQQVNPAAQAWLRRGTAIACHARIGQQLLEHGYARVVDATFDDDAIIAKLESIGFET